MLLAALAILAICLLANAVVLDEFWILLRQDDLALAGSDMATHFLRIRHASELYLPSGHRFGWDPYWFQGFVPFLLYPHLTYVAVAVAGMVLPIGLERLFNLYVLAIFFALPVTAGLSVFRSLGLVPALVVTSWFAVLSTIGAGLSGVFVIGLLSQQVGTILFTLLAVDLVLTRRLDRAAIWLGLMPLVQVHASLVAALAWLCAGAAAFIDESEAKAKLRSWLAGSVLAVVIASPTLIGLLYGWGSIGTSTSYAEKDGVLSGIAGGAFLAPVPTMLAIASCFFASLSVAPAADRRRLWIFWAPLGLLLFAVSAHKWNTGLPFVDRILSVMLFLRTLPFAFAWAAVVAACYWQRFPGALRWTVVALSLLGVLYPRHHEAAVDKSIGSVWRGGTSKPRSVVDYRNALRWIADDLGNDTATLAIAVPRPHGTWLAEAIGICRQPLLGGHGIELSSIDNHNLITRTTGMPCASIGNQIREYGIGYIAGTSTEQRSKLEECLEREPDYHRGAWWVFSTGTRWSSTHPAATGFRHDPTWTNLEWTLEPAAQQSRMRLPVAMNSQWIAEVDGTPVEIKATQDRMMRVDLPAGSKRLELRYEGYPGEWSTVVMSLLALVAAAVRVRRGTRSAWRSVS